MIEDAAVETDERGFLLCLTGDFTVECDRYLTRDESTLCLRLPQDAAIQLHAQTNKIIGPWVAEKDYERDAYDRASPEERAAVLRMLPGGDPRKDVAEAMLEAADLARKTEREHA